MKRFPPQSAPTGDTLRETIRVVFAEVLQCAATDIDLTLRVTELPGMDSLNLLQAVVSCEEQCGIRLDEDRLFDVRTGDDLCALIEKTQQEAADRP